MAETVMAEDLTGNVVIVTGASRGIGKGLAIGLAARGAEVVCAARTVDAGTGELPGSIAETVEAIRASGRTATAIRCDIGSEHDLEELVATTVARHGRIDALVNNAMTPTRTPLAESSVQEWDDSMRVNVRSLYVLTRLVVPHMRDRGGSIVNISSAAAAHEVSPFMPAGYVIYSVAKAALERFSTAAAPELRPLGITINALRPGAVRTEHTELEFGPGFDWSGWAEPAAIVPPVASLVARDDPALTGRVLDVADFGRSWGV